MNKPRLEWRHSEKVATLERLIIFNTKEGYKYECNVIAADINRGDRKLGRHTVNGALVNRKMWEIAVRYRGLFSLTQRGIQIVRVGRSFSFLDKQMIKWAEKHKNKFDLEYLATVLGRTIDEMAGAVLVYGRAQGREGIIYK